MLLGDVESRKNLVDMVVREFLINRLDYSVRYDLVNVGVRFPDFLSGVFASDVDSLYSRVGLFGDFGLSSDILELEVTYELESTRYDIERHGSIEVSEVLKYLENISQSFLLYYVDNVQTMVYRVSDTKVRLSVFLI